MFLKYYFEIQKIDDLTDSCPTIRRVQVGIRATRRDLCLCSKNLLKHPPNKRNRIFYIHNILYMCVSLKTIMATVRISDLSSLILSRILI